jgi:hypothetical protein
MLRTDVRMSSGRVVRRWRLFDMSRGKLIASTFPSTSILLYPSRGDWTPASTFGSRSEVTWIFSVFSSVVEHLIRRNGKTSPLLRCRIPSFSYYVKERFRFSNKDKHSKRKQRLSIFRFSNFNFGKLKWFSLAGTGLSLIGFWQCSR